MKWHFGNNNTNGEKQQRMSPPPTIPQREFPLSHPAVEAILCENCRSLEVSVFDPSCPTCSDILKDQETTSIAHILAILRQWVPQIQQNIDLFMKEILLRGAHPDDRDSLTDMTLLHFACKAGASGVGDMHAAAKVVELLLSRSASLSLRCRWTQMTPIHYAAFFDSPLVLRILLKKSGGDGVSDGCPEYDNGSPLHIAASNLCYDSARVLLEFGAKTKQMDDLGRTPLECIPDPSSFRAIPNVQEVIGKLSRLLSHKNSMASEAVRKLSSTVNGHGNGTANGYRRALLTAMGIRVGDRVAVNGNRSGILRYCGTTEFAPGIWAGCEMATTEGKNNGSVNGVVYFQCKENHGLFTPISRISKLGSSPDRRRASSTGNLRARWGGVKTDGIRSKIFRSKCVTDVVERLKCLCHFFHVQGPGDKESPTFEVGQRVLVSSGGRMKGTVRYAGPVQFANGFWYGVELDYPEGRNDGSVQGIRYFTCQLGYGIFCPPGRIHQIPPSPSSSPVPNGNSTDGKSVTTPLSTGQQNGSTDSHVNGSDKEDPLEAGFAVNR
ncbi:unnamed protein product [Cyprideis torosa]|uniref:Uncharacterized protein n=1 Tax=Cyprideis torosa TaxID=163714 RepID=A0A7R8W5X2_9CRUS|nr:unnamed protein product [Cyprideis torosa]CAG0885810.1 unnamed protein product [Cyprideis torosa]